jgi:SAM-dependent methyltransferase
MNHEEYAVMYQVEDHHWWYLGMERITCYLLDRQLTQSGTLRILDAGCGTGAVMNYLAHYGQPFGFDFAAEALRFCHQRGHRSLTQASAMTLPYASGVFDLITSFDVISEFGVETAQALHEFARVLKPNGALLLRLPAYDWLRGKHDVAVNTQHRFTAAEIKFDLQRAGFTPQHTSYANMFLFPIAVFKRLSERILNHRQQGSDLTLNPGVINGLLRSILGLEAPLIAAAGLPFGLTVIAFSRKAAER